MASVERKEAAPRGLAVWVLAARPKTLGAALGPVVIGTALAVGDNGFHLLAAVAALFGAIMIQIATNYANDYFDFKSGADKGERLGPTRATQAGWVSPSAMKRATMFAFGLAFCAGIYLVSRGGWPIVAIGLSSILFGILYTGGPYPLGYNGLGELFVIIFFGPVAVAGTYYVQTLQFSWLPVLVGLSPGLFSVGILTVNNLRDIAGDRQSGKRTLAVRLGASFARWEYTVCIVGAILLPIVVALSLSPPRLWTLLALITLASAVAPIRAVFVQSGRALNDVLAATGRLLVMYALFFSIGWLL